MTATVLAIPCRPGTSDPWWDDCLLGAAATLVEQRQVNPERHRSGRQRHSDRFIAAWRTSPVERKRADCRSWAAIGRPFGRGPPLPFGFRLFRTGPDNIGRGGAQSARARCFRRAFRARRLWSCRAADSARPRPRLWPQRAISLPEAVKYPRINPRTRRSEIRAATVHQPMVVMVRRLAAGASWIRTAGSVSGVSVLPGEEPRVRIQFTPAASHESDELVAMKRVIFRITRPTTEAIS